MSAELDVLRTVLGNSALQEVVAHGETTIVLDHSQILPALKALRDTPALGYTMLLDVCGVDNRRRDGTFWVVYHLLAPHSAARLRLKVQLSPDDLTVPSATAVHPGANWFERETYDLLGIHFSAHPDLRRILMPEDYEGHPLRRDFPLHGYPSGEEEPYHDNRGRRWPELPLALRRQG